MTPWEILQWAIAAADRYKDRGEWSDYDVLTSHMLSRAHRVFMKGDTAAMERIAADLEAIKPEGEP